MREKEREGDISEKERRIAASLDDQIPRMRRPFIVSNHPPLNGD